MKTRRLFSHWYDELLEKIEVFGHYYQIVRIDYSRIGIGHTIGYEAMVVYKEK